MLFDCFYFSYVFICVGVYIYIFSCFSLFLLCFMFYVVLCVLRLFLFNYLFLYCSLFPRNSRPAIEFKEILRK